MTNLSWRAVHPDREARLGAIEAMNIDHDYSAMYRRTVMVELAWEMRFGWNLAFYRPFAVPRMAELLAGTGQITGHTLKRSHDTGLIMYELFEHGLEHPRARQVIRWLNRMHRRWQIEQEDYLYVLAALIVVPARFTAQYGWRPMSATEQAAAVRFYRDLAQLMAIRDAPGSYLEMERFLDNYEATHVHHSTAGERLVRATLPFLQERIPGLLAGRADEIAGFFMDERLRAALALPSPRPSTAGPLRAVLAARRALVRRRPP
jgi:hypothetical protein